MELYQFAYLPDFTAKIHELTLLARSERWDYIRDPQPCPHYILINYIKHTFKRVYSLNRLYPTENYLFNDGRLLCFNTGLFTENFEPIFALFQVNAPQYNQRWEFISFFKESAHELRKIGSLPTRANYFDNIGDLIYNTKIELRINIDHILDDENNKMRIPETYRNAPNLAMLFRSTALDYARIRIMENYKAAVPQFFNGKIQFLVPISLGDPKVVDLSLAVGKDGDVYTGRTCLTLDMAYNNARLIAKPESDWLIGV